MSTKKAQEKWVVPVYNGIHYTNYLICSDGRLVSKSKFTKGNQKIKLEFGEYHQINPLNCKLGYLTFNLYQTSDKRNLMYHHRLMWESFVCPITKGMVIDHINADKKDNRLSNLQMITHGENLKKGHTIDKQIQKKRK